MKAALLRVGIDAGCGGIQGPLFKNGAFEYIPIPNGPNIDPRTYGQLIGRHGQPLIDYFPYNLKLKMINKSAHLDPEFETFTYGDPTRPKAGLRKLENGDMLIFYCGLEGWDFHCEPGLYLMGYFEVLTAGLATEYDPKEIESLFGKNFHVLHNSRFENERENLVLVKGSARSRLLDRAVLISTIGRDKSGRPLKIISPEMRKIFGDFKGHLSFQRSPPRWVDPEYVYRAAKFIRSLK
jgi:hypothetical protein